ncbi:MAG: DNA mismatch repair protein MutS [Polyangiaceae bacterium]
MTPEAHYQERQAELARKAEALDARERRMSTLRGISFLSTLGLGVYAAFHPGATFWIVTAVAGALFIVAVVAHAVLITRKMELDQRSELVKRALSRIEDAYEGFAERGEPFSPEQHPYSKDLDIFGARSLFQLLVTAETQAGKSALASWLLTRASAKVIGERQEAVRELAARPDLREDLAVLAKNARARMAPDALFTWGEARPVFEDSPVLRLALTARFLAPVTIALAVLAWTIGPEAGPLRYGWMAALTLQLLVVLRTGSLTERALAQASSREEPLGRFAPLFERIENASFGAPLLQRCQAALVAGTAKPGESGSESESVEAKGDSMSASRAMARLQTILSFADLRHAGIFHLIFHLFTLWDIWCAVALEKWRARHGRRIRAWIEALATVEALASLAAFAHEHPEYAFPEVTEGAPSFEAEALGHPLLPGARRVVNSVSFGAAAKAPLALLITGSNMSGKSTLLRSIGVNAVLALSGAPVCAKRLVTTVADVRTSMRITDSLEQGVSHFYAELQRLKEITAAADAGGPVLFLLDEVLHGTNSRERQLGAKSVVKHLLEKGAVGGVSSHDLGLASLEEETAGKVRNVHFEEHVEDGKMAFDYRLKQGVVSTTNALRLMRMIGLPVTEE